MLTEGFVRTASIQEAISILEEMSENALQAISATSIGSFERVYMTRSFNHLIFTDGIGLSCYGGTTWEVSSATFCLCFNRKTEVVEECRVRLR